MKFNIPFLDQLSKQLRQPLPGRSAQLQMSNFKRPMDPAPDATFRKACVMALFYPNDKQEMHLVLIERMSYKNDRHAGQIAFPGGGLEPSDKTYEAAALREVEEEVGIDAHSIKVLGPMTELFISVSNFMVYPFVGYIDYQPTFIPQPTEVKSVVEAPLRVLLDEKNLQTKSIKVGNGIILSDVPYFSVKEHTVWGATAMMLSELMMMVNACLRE